MNNNTQLYQPPGQRSYVKSVIKPLLLVVLGIIIGAGVISIFYFLRSEPTTGISQKTRAGVLANFKDDLMKSFSTVFGKDTVIEIYTMETEEDTIKVSTTVNLSDEQFKKIFGIEPEGLYPGELKGLVIIAQAEYVNKKGEWALKGESKIYQGIDLVLLQQSLGTAQEKARDASIKADLAYMRAAAEMWAVDHGDSYDGFCGGVDVQEAVVHIADNGKTALCDDAVTKWAAFVPLYNTTAQCFCVDYRGTGKELNKPCPKTAVTVCP